jgi:hypothetical protein
MNPSEFARPVARRRAMGLEAPSLAAIVQLAALERQIRTAAAQFDGDASLYSAGSAAGRGISAGLRSQLGAVDAAMKALARSVAAAVRRGR